MSEGTSDLEKKLLAILSNPEALSGIMNLAKGFGLDNAGAPTATNSVQESEIAKEASMPASMTPVVEAKPVLGAPSHANQFVSEKSIGLLLALKPFLSGNKCEKIDVITQLLKIATLTDLLK